MTITKDQVEELTVMFPERMDLKDFVSFYKSVCEALPSPKVTMYGDFSIMREGVEKLSDLEEGIHIKSLDLFTSDGSVPILHLETLMDYEGDGRPYAGVRDRDHRHYSEFHPQEIDNAISVMKKIRDVSEEYFAERNSQNSFSLE